jgi:hypothetical protein
MVNLVQRTRHRLGSNPKGIVINQPGVARNELRRVAESQKTQL